MPIPKFSIGEEVILQSKTHPQYNGEYIVEEIHYGYSWVSRNSGKIAFGVRSWGYFLNEIFPTSCGTRECRVEEHELKKKHPPADKPFVEIMTSLKKGVPA